MTDAYQGQGTRNARGQSGLPRPFVISDLIWQRETERIFSQNWMCVGRETELLGGDGIRPFNWEQHRLFIVRGDAGPPKVFRNFCRHRGSVLVTDDNCRQIGQRLQCPYHAWTYDRQGKLLAAPNMDGATDFAAEDFGLLEVPSAIEAGFVWINFSPSQTIQEFLQPLADVFHGWRIAELQVAAELKYRVRANWKLIFQNYNECYHCPIVHPALNRLTPFRGASNWLEQGPILGGPMQLAERCRTMSETGEWVGTPIDRLSQHQREQVLYFTIFPSLFLSAHPDYVMIHLLQRVSVNETEIVCQFLFQERDLASDRFDPSQAVKFWDVTNRQDWEVCQGAQLGMEDPNYVPGPYSSLESVVSAFDRYYLDEVGDVSPSSVNEATGQ